ncbi:MAG: HNH endonuclease [Planctomycetota bacterium]
MTTKRREVSAAQRLQVLQRDRFACVYCGTAGTDAELQVDHRIAVANGGSNHIANLVTACAKCNRSKGAGDAPKPRSSAIVLAVGDVVALGLSDDRCPVGLIVAIDTEAIRLDLMSFLDGTFGHRTEVVRRVDVERAVVAGMSGPNEADTAPLGEFQTQWRRRRSAG